MNDLHSRGYERIKVLGKGSFGEALLVRCTKTQKHVVAKQVQLGQLSKKERREAENEISILRKLSHPNIVKYIDSFTSKKTLNIIMEFADGGDLSQRIKKLRGTPMKEDACLAIFVQISMALKHLHDKHILHRDMKTQNVFLKIPIVSGCNLQQSYPVVKLGDFGISTTLLNTMALAKTMCGTPYYFSPELCQNKPYNNKSDIWSLGCILYEMCTAKHPFTGSSMQSLMSRIVKGSFNPIPSSYSSDIRLLLDSLLARDMRQRPGINKILSLQIVIKKAKALADTPYVPVSVPIQQPKPSLLQKQPCDNIKTNEDRRQDIERLKVIAQQKIEDNSKMFAASLQEKKKKYQQKKHQPIQERTPVIRPTPTPSRKTSDLIDQHVSNHVSDLRKQLDAQRSKFEVLKGIPCDPTRAAFLEAKIAAVINKRRPSNPFATESQRQADEIKLVEKISSEFAMKSEQRNPDFGRVRSGRLALNHKPSINVDLSDVITTKPVRVHSGRVMNVPPPPPSPPPRPPPPPQPKTNVSSPIDLDKFLSNFDTIPGKGQFPVTSQNDTENYPQGEDPELKQAMQLWKERELAIEKQQQQQQQQQPHEDKSEVVTSLRRSEEDQQVVMSPQRIVEQKPHPAKRVVVINEPQQTDELSDLNKFGNIDDVPAGVAAREVYAQREFEEDFKSVQDNIKNSVFKTIDDNDPPEDEFFQEHAGPLMAPNDDDTELVISDHIIRQIGENKFISAYEAFSSGDDARTAAILSNDVALLPLFSQLLFCQNR